MSARDIANARRALAEAREAEKVARERANAFQGGPLPPLVALERVRARRALIAAEDATRAAGHALAALLDAGDARLDASPLESTAADVERIHRELLEAHARANAAASAYVAKLGALAEERRAAADPGPLVVVPHGARWPEVLAAARAPRMGPRPAAAGFALAHEEQEILRALARESAAKRAREEAEAEDRAKREALRVENERADRERYAKADAVARAAREQLHAELVTLGLAPAEVSQ